MNRMNQKFNDRARYGFVTSRQRVRHYLEVMMLHAAKHPWMRWTSVRFNKYLLEVLSLYFSHD
jgi:hypothetical protein